MSEDLLEDLKVLKVLALTVDGILMVTCCHLFP